VPYDRGDVVARVHRHGEVQSVEHTDEGTRIDARVPAALVADLEDYAIVRSA
jgi:GTPase